MTIFDTLGNQICILEEASSKASPICLEALDLSLARIRGFSFSGGYLYWVTFFEADLAGCSFEDAHLLGVDFKGATLGDCNFSHATFKYDNLGLPSELQNADFKDACLEGVQFLGAVYNRKTRWPNNFDLAAHPGLQKV